VIRRTWTPAGREEKPKNGKELKVELSDAAIAALQAHPRELQKEHLKEGTPLPEWVFPNREGKPLNMTDVLIGYSSRTRQSGFASTTAARHTSHICDAATESGRVARMRERSDRSFLDQSHGGRLRQMDQNCRSTCGEPASDN